ncbi:YceI family protein [Croceibacterium sp. LX-88]|jgi:polyisoprenoid-binding protein YceI|uniref:YceI family protein n=1 Tax=Croceibacterium selenioxidans TaxID=2838833 RepID=A0ABS5W2F6_9SPHN|nr:YceI family protein [Croceibacterium selenioxidans]MBT2133834.1 YceI family protein [Croceibacterium selenioxidans]
MRKLTLTLAAAGVAALTIGTLQAQGGAMQPPGKMDPSLVQAGTYAADPNHSLVGWRVNHLGFNDYFGIFGSVSGTLSIDPAALQNAKVDVTIPVAQVTTASAGLTQHLLKPAGDNGKADFFGAAPAPARFVSTKVEVNGTDAKITGDLTLNGVTKPVVLDAKFTGAGNAMMPPNKLTVGFEGETTIKRSDFGVSYGIPIVSDEVELDITVAFEKQ